MTAILIIDDEPRLAESTFASYTTIDVHALPPQDVDARHLRDVDLVIIDYSMGEWYDHVHELPYLAAPSDGLAVAATIRGRLSEAGTSRSTAIALSTGHLDEIAHGLPMGVREHATARLHNLEWVFRKSDPLLGPRAEALAAAAATVCSVPRIDAPAVRALLGVDSLGHATDAWSAIVHASPPVHASRLDSTGLALLRWLLHRVMPFPTFLVNDWHVAARLGVSVESFRSCVLEMDNPVSTWLAPARYVGVAAGLFSARWWREQVEGLLIDELGGHSLRESAVREFVVSLDERLDPIEAGSVVLLDDAYDVVRLGSSGSAVRMALEDWPPFAEFPWVERSVVNKSSVFQEQVIPEDRPQ